MIFGHKGVNGKKTNPYWNNVVEIRCWDVLSVTLIIQIG